MVKWRMGELPKLPQVLRASVECHPGRGGGGGGGGGGWRKEPTTFLSCET